jgi:hypothetical protein
MIKAALVINEVNGKRQITIELANETNQRKALP